MKTRRVIQVVAGGILLSAILIWGCAELDDSTMNTGSVLRVGNIEPSDGAGLEGPEVDVTKSFCLDGTTEPAIFDVFATISLENDSPGLGTTQNSYIKITSYEVQYIFRSGNILGAVNVPLPPIKPPLSIWIKPGGTVTQDILLLPVTHKIYYTGNGGNDGVVTIYEAKITFYGVNEFGDEVKGTGSTYLEFLDWATC